MNPSHHHSITMDPKFMLLHLHGGLYYVKGAGSRAKSVSHDDALL